MATRPWKPADHPLWWRWLEPQQSALADARTATSRPRYFIPFGPPQQMRRDLAGDFITGQSGLAAILPTLGRRRGMANLLRVDAMRAAGTGDWPLFRADVLAIFRLSRLTGQGPSTMERLVAVAINALAASAITNALRHADPPPDEIARLQADLENLPPACTFVDSTDLLGRWTTLDICQFAARMGLDRWHSLEQWTPIMTGPPELPRRSAAWWIAAQTVPLNFDSILRQENAAFDRMAAAMRLPSFPDRIAAVRRVSKEFSQEDPGISDLLAHPPRALLADTFRSYDKMVVLTQRSQANQDMARLALALALFHSHNGIYPDTLQELPSPEAALHSLPQDGFSGKDYIYRRAGPGYILYSVGDENRGEDESREAKWRVLRMDH